MRQPMFTVQFSALQSRVGKMLSHIIGSPVAMMLAGLVLLSCTTANCQQLRLIPSSQDDALEAVVDSLFEKYDKDKDGLLNSIELRQITRVPGLPLGYFDDKKVSREELLSAFKAGKVSRSHSVVGITVRDSDEGVEITGVVPDSGAEAAGLRAGDVIIEVNRTEVDSVDALLELLGDVKAGERARFVYRRSGEVQAAVVEVKASLSEGFNRLMPSDWKTGQSRPEGLRTQTFGNQPYFGLESRRDPGYNAEPLALPRAPGASPSPDDAPQRTSPSPGNLESVRTHVWILKTNHSFVVDRFEGKTSTQIAEAVSGVSRASGFKADHFQVTTPSGQKTHIETGGSIPVVEGITKLPGGGTAYQLSNRDVGVDLTILPAVNEQNVALSCELKKTDIEDSDQLLAEVDQNPIRATQTIQLALQSTIVCRNGKSECVSVQQSGRSWLVIILAEWGEPPQEISSIEDARRQQQEAARAAIIKQMREMAERNPPGSRGSSRENPNSSRGRGRDRQ